MAAARSNRRRSRKGRGSVPASTPSSKRRVQQAERERQRGISRATAHRTLGTAGERPRGIFGPVPVSEFAILAGLVALVVGTIGRNGSAVDAGILMMALGVFEVTAREHFSGFRSHTTLLAFLPAVIVEALYALVIGVPSRRTLLLVPVIPVFCICYWLLRRQFRVARHARVVKHD